MCIVSSRMDQGKAINNVEIRGNCISGALVEYAVRRKGMTVRVESIDENLRTQAVQPSTICDDAVW